MTFNVGDTVYLTRPANRRVRIGTEYRVHGINELNHLLVGGYWMRADRFSLTPPIAPPALPPRIRTYETYSYPGCCGAMIVYFGGDHVDLGRLKATMDRFIWPGYIAVLNNQQHNAGGGKMLEEAGWVQSCVTASNSGKDQPLYHYMYVHKKPADAKVTEAPRVFR